MEKRRKILIDTDIGDDIDDAFALYYAMRLGFDIVGMTTVYGNTEERARMTKKLLRRFENGYENVPVYAGYDRYGGDGDGEYPHLCQYTPDLEGSEYAPNGKTPADAVEFILDCCRKYGKELTVVAIGPFGNIAKAIERDREAINGIDRVVIMGGAYFKQYTDWNVMCDVSAADVMFKDLRNLECLGADVTHLLEMTKEERETVLYAQNHCAGAEEVRALHDLWHKAKPTNRLVMHDALVIHYLADPDVCGMEDICIHLFTEGYAKGLTLNVDAYRHTFLNDAYRDFDFTRKTRVARTVDRERFMSAFVKSFEE